MSKLKKILVIVYQPYKFLIFAPVMVLTTVFFGTLLMILLPIFRPKTLGRLSGVPWAKTLGFFTPMTVSVSGRERIDKNQSYIIACNHQSHYDILVLYGWIGVDIKWVMKASLRKVPVIGISCERLEHIFVDRSNTAAALASINQAKSRIVNGTSVLFFPEGTRSPDGNLLPFKKGAFRMALDLNLPILPITITGTKTILPKGTINLFPGKARMTIHQPIPVDNYRDENIKELMAEVRDRISSAL